MNIKRIVLIASASFDVDEALTLNISESTGEIREISVVVEHRSPIYFLHDSPGGFRDYATGETVFVIDVHCVNAYSEKLQLQGGVLVFRHLLNLFKGNHDKLKVVFYSPLAKELLVKDRPENYVLKLLPFVECNYDNSFLNGIAGDQNSVAAQISKYQIGGWPRFNNASENLLSGWALTNKDAIKIGNDIEAKIPLNGMDLLIIDDELSSWASTYQSILDKTNLPVSGLPTQHGFRKTWRENKGIDLWLGHAEKFDAVLSDLYIEENHEDTNPYKSLKDIEKISGYQLFKALKNKYPYLPYMMFTSSSKVWNADAFRSEGVWAWAVKETSLEASVDDKVAQFEHFTANIKKLVDTECRLYSEVWKRLLELEARNNIGAWWNDIAPDSTSILKECLFILDTVYSQRSTFETNKVADFEGRLCAQIFNNLGGLCEELDIHPKNKDKKKKTQCVVVSSFIYELRSYYSHKLHYRKAKRVMALFCIDLFCSLLALNTGSHLQLDKEEENFILKDDFIENTDFNYFLQFRAKRQFWGITVSDALVEAVEKSFAGIATEIFSNRYEREIQQKEVDLQVGNEYIKRRRVVQQLHP